MGNKRIRDPAYLKWIRGKPCLVCGSRYTVGHHLMQVPGEPSAMGLRSGDNWVVPLCHEHHLGRTGVHADGNERRYFDDRGIDALTTAETYWRNYHDRADRS